MEALQGKDVSLDFFSGEFGDFVSFICARTCSYKETSSLISCKTKGSGRWADFLEDERGYSIACDGIVPKPGGVGVSVWDLASYAKQGVPIPFRMIFRDKNSNIAKAILGYVYITDIDISAPMDFVEQSISFVGTGEPSIQDNLLLCQATIGTFTLDTVTSLILIFGYTGLADAVRLDYAFDGGAVNSKLTSTSTGAFSVPRFTLANGHHVMTVYPICESGEAGTPIQIEFDLS